MYNNLYCVADPQPGQEITVNGAKLKVGNCPIPTNWLPGSTGNSMDGVGAASKLYVGSALALAALYTAA